MSLSNLSVGKKIMMVGGVPLVLMIVIGVASILGIAKQNKTNAQVDHTHVVVETVLALEAAAVDMETGMRGYLLAGEESFLDPYNNGRETFDALGLELKNKIDGNPDLLKLLGEIEKLIEDWQKDVTEPTIALRRQIGNAKTMDDMADEVGQAKGKKYFDQFREQIKTFIDREQELILKRQKEVTDTSKLDDEARALLEQTAKWVAHTHHVIAQAWEIEAAAVDMETGMRGYLLAGKDEFLDPYRDGQEHFSKVITKLSDTVSDNASQVQLLSEIKKKYTRLAVKCYRTSHCQAW